jgi:hypothetical protein
MARHNKAIMDRGVVNVIKGMTISGFMVRATKYVEHEPLAYGLFPTVEAAKAWAEQMIIPNVIEPVYTPAYNRG